MMRVTSRTTAPSTDLAGTGHGGVRDAKRALRSQVLAQRDSMPAATRIAAGRARRFRRGDRGAADIALR